MAKETENLTPKGQATYRRIMEAAAECVASLGIENTSVTTIAKQAGVSRSLVAHYLPRQDDLLISIMKHIGYVGTQMVTPKVDNQSGEEKLLFSVNSNFLFFEQFPQYYSCQLLLYNTSPIKRECKELNRLLYNAFIERMKTYLKLSEKEKNLTISEGELNQFAEQIYSNLDGALIVHFFMLTAAEREEYRKRFMIRMTKDMRTFFFNHSLSNLTSP